MRPRSRTAAAGLAVLLGVLEQIRLWACGPYAPGGVRFGTFYRLTPIAQMRGLECNGGYLHRFDEVVQATFRESLAHTASRRILGDEIDAARRVERSGDVATAAQRFDEIAKTARLAFREHRAAGDVITYALDVAADRVDLYRHAGVDPDALVSYAEARDLYDLGEIEKALAALPALHLQAGAALPDQILYLEGAIAWKQGRIPDATAAFEKISRDMPLLPKAAAALFCLGRILKAQGQDAAAETQWKALVERFPRHDLADDALGELALIAGKRHDVGAAVALYDRIRNQYPEGDVTERARESLLALGPEVLQAAADPKAPKAIMKALDPYLPFYRAYFALKPQAAAAADPAARVAALASLQVLTAGTFLPGEARYRMGVLQAASGMTELAGQTFGELGNVADLSLRCRALFMAGTLTEDPAVRQASMRAIIDAYPVHSTADDALFFLEVKDQEGVDLLRKVVRAYPHRDRIVSAANGIIGRSSTDLGEQVAEILRSAGHEDRLLFARSADSSYATLMARYPDSPFALDGFFRQAYLAARRREELLCAAAPTQWEWAGRLSAFRAEDEQLAEPATPGAEVDPQKARKRQETEAVGEARALLKFAKGFLASPRPAEAKKLVELKLPMALYLAGQVQDAASKAADVGAKYPDDPYGDEAAIVSVLALADLGRSVEALAAAKGFVTRFGRSYYTMLAKERQAILLEDMGRRAEALFAYIDIGYGADARYFIDVLLTDEELAQAIADHPDHPWTPVLRHAQAVRALRGGDPTSARAVFEAAAPPAGIGDAELSTDAVSAMSDQALLGPVVLPALPPPSATELARDASLKLDVVNRLAEIETQSASATTDEERAEALYQAGAFFYKHDYALYDEALWLLERVDTLKFLSMRSESESKRFMTYLLAHNSKLVARARFQDVVTRYPQAAAAPKALYMEARCDEYLNGYSSLDHAWFGKIGKDSVPRLIALADNYPQSSLADDALYWAGFLSAEQGERQRLWRRLRESFPDGDMVKKLPPASPAPSPDVESPIPQQ